MINWNAIFNIEPKSHVQDVLATATKIAFMDIDHTLSDSYWRDPMIGNATWDEYHAAGKDDKPIPEMLGLASALYEGGWTLVGITGRPERFRQMTMKWLLDYEVMIEDLIMRGNEDYRPTAEYKLAEAKRYLAIAAKSAEDLVAIVFDDREDVIAAFKSERIVAVHVQTSGGRNDEKGKEDEKSQSASATEAARNAALGGATQGLT